MAIDDSMMPSKECAGRDLADKGTRTGVTDTYGAGSGLDTGIVGKTSISGDTKSDGKQEGRK